MVEEDQSGGPREPNRLTPPEQDPLLQLRGSGKDVWADEHADDYVARLRHDWEYCWPPIPPTD